MTYETTTDLDLVRRIIVTAPVWRRMANDAAPDPETFRVAPKPDIGYVVASEGGDPRALFLLKTEKTPGEAEIHFAMLPEAWGRAREIASGFLDWVWRETSLVRLVGPLPTYNRLALALAVSLGFEVVEVLPCAVRKGGKSFDLAILEMGRP